MGNIRIERVPIQEMGLWRIRADHLMLVFQQDPLDYGEFQDRWWVMEGTRDVNPDGTVTVGVDGANGVTTISEANGGLSPQEVLDTLAYPWWRGSRIIPSVDTLSDWGYMAAIAREIDSQQYPYYAFNFEFSSLPVSNSSSVVASLLFYIGIDIAETMPYMFLTYTVGTETIFGTGDGDTIRLTSSFNTILSGEGDDRLEGTDTLSQREKFYGGLGNDTFMWSEGSHVYHGGQPGLDYAADGADLIDYNNIGYVRLEKAPWSVPHTRPDYLAYHAAGTDRLFSIESLSWNDSNDTVVIGEGVFLQRYRPVLDLKGEETESGGDMLDFSNRTTGLLLVPSDRPDVILAGTAAADGNFADDDGVWARSLERVIGSSGDDRLFAGGTLTSLDGGSGNDILSGRLAAPGTGASPAGYDIELSGGTGDDTIISGSGRSLALGSAGADVFVLGAKSDEARRVEFVIADADAGDRLFVPYEFLLPDGGEFAGSDLFPVLGAVTTVVGSAAFAELPQNAGPGSFNGTEDPGYFFLISQLPLDTFEDGGGAATLTNQILFNRDGSDLLIHIYSNSYLFDPMILTLEGQDYLYREYDIEFATEAVVRVVNFQEGMLGIRFYEIGDELPFPFSSRSGPPDPAKLWNAEQFAQAGGDTLREPLPPEPETPIFDRPEDGETDTREVIAGDDSDNVLTLPDTLALAGFSSGAELSGFGGNDELLGGDGHDTLDGGAGDDTMAGGRSNDRYIVDSAADSVIEALNSGIDTVISSVPFALPDHVEDLTLTASAVLGQGNSAANRLIGTMGSNTLFGLDGDDSIAGGLGDDVLDGGRGDDGYIYQAGDGTDTILSSVAEDFDVLVITGFAPAEVGVFQWINPSDVILRLSDGGRIILDSFFAGASIDAIVFDDETIWTEAFLTSAALESGPLNNDAPVTGADDGFFSYATDVLIPKSQLLANDRDLDGDPLMIVAAASPLAGADVSVTAEGDVRVSAPTSHTGLVPFTYTVSDGRGGLATASGSVTILPNSAPALTGAGLADVRFATGQAVSYALPADTFNDADGDPLVYSADLADGSALPSWLSFDASLQHLSGTPPRGFAGDLAIRVTASDSIAATSTTFLLKIGSPVGVTLVGTAGSDALTGGDGDDSIAGGRGDDILSGLGGDDEFFASGNAGYDVYDGGAGLDTIVGSDGNDTIGVRGISVTSIEAIEGGDGEDILRFDNLANVIDLSSVYVTGIELITAGPGHDILTGTAAADIISGGTGNDRLHGGAGDDVFLVQGRQGYDFYDGGDGFDIISGTDGNDELLLQQGSLDLVSIEEFNLGDGFDVLKTFGGDDLIDLSSMTALGLERIDAGNGNDRIVGTAANEILAGGLGRDTLVFTADFGHDTIEDFEIVAGARRVEDVIDVTALEYGSFAALLAHIFDDGPNSVIRSPDQGSSITLLNVAKSTLLEDDFYI